MSTLSLDITLNGTDENPWHAMGLKRNPFPQIAKAEYDAIEERLAELDGNPIRSKGELRQRMRGWCSPELVDLCCAKYERGKRVRFTITFPQ